MNRFAVCLMVWLGATAPAGALAQLVTISGDLADGTVGTDGSIDNLSDASIRPGVAGNDVHGQATIFFFALPHVSSPSSIVSATLELEYLGISQFTTTVVPEFNVDIFGLGVRATPTILASDYYDGDASLSADALLAAALISPSTPIGHLQIAGDGLRDYVASLYLSNGTPTADFLAIRANPDKDLPAFSLPYRGYELASADNTDVGGAFVPQLTLEVVPEPSSILLVAGLAMGLGWRIGRRLTRRNGTLSATE